MKELLEQIEEMLEAGGKKKRIIFLVISGIFLLFSILKVPFFFDPVWVVLLLCGVPIVLEAILALLAEGNIKAGLLVTIALIASVCIGESFAAAEVAFIMQLGELLEELTVEKARSGIDRLVRLTPQTARIIKDGEEILIPAEEVAAGDILKVLPGETVPVDGVITFGKTSVNQGIITGESLPVDKSEGDSVSGGTLNQFGAFTMEATRVLQDSALERMIKLVESASADKTKIARVADKWATWIVVIALGLSLFTWGITKDLIRAVTVLVVFCPCALVLATPTAIMAAIGNASRYGFLVREGDALERLYKVTKIVFDKTGTLTYGIPNVTAVESLSSYSREEIFAYAASVESLSEHPLGKAIALCHKKTPPPVTNFVMVPGEGVKGTVEGKEIVAGKIKMVAGLRELSMPLEARSLQNEYLNQGATLVYISIDAHLAGYLVLSDTLREDSKHIPEELSSLGAVPVLATGDNQNAAKKVAAEFSIQMVHANCLPEDKLSLIDGLKKAGEKVCMVGDGVNDAPALKTATVGIAMGGIGSHIAMDAADIILVDDDIKKLPHLLALSKRMMKTIYANLAFSLGLNFLSIFLAMTGVLNPIMGALVHNAGSVLVVLNSIFLLGWKKR